MKTAAATLAALIACTLGLLWTALLSDAIHPNATGSQVWADTIAAAFTATSVDTP